MFIIINTFHIQLICSSFVTFIIKEVIVINSFSNELNQFINPANLPLL